MSLGYVIHQQDSNVPVTAEKPAQAATQSINSFRIRNIRFVGNLILNIQKAIFLMMTSLL